LIKIDDTTTVLVDSGKKPKSIIFDTTIQAVADAKSSIYFTSQLIPDGKFLNALFNAYRNKKDVIVIAPKNNSFSPMFSLLNKINRLAMNIKKRNVPIIFLDKMLHAKLTIIDKRLVVFGSHNMSQKGVRMRTTEIAIMSTNSELVNNLCEYFDKLKPIRGA
jgi:phosphatidylserine/phosphatidylglycerophosphate/cardiolipin synthase-like enzyme